MLKIQSYLASHRPHIEHELGQSIIECYHLSGKDIYMLDGNSSLEELGLDSINAAEVKRILEQRYDVFLSVKEVVNLNIMDLRAIEKSNHSWKGDKFCNDVYIEKCSVLGELYSNFLKLASREKDINNLQPILRLPSLLNDGSTNELPLTVEKTIFVLPSIEGLASVMEILSQRIDQQVLCFQYDLNVSCVSEFAKTCFLELKKRLTPDKEKPFRLLGYSFGGLIAMEIAYMLEMEGRQGFVYMIDSSPNIVKSINNSLYDYSDFHTNIAEFVKAASPNTDITKLQESIKKITNWNVAADTAICSLPKNIPYKQEDMMILFRSLFMRHSAIQQYQAIPKHSLMSKGVLIRAKNVILNIPQEHDLMEYFVSPIEEYLVDGNHFTVLAAQKLSYLLINLHK